MRIAFVAHHGSIHTRRWAAFFADRGHDVHVVTCGDAAAPREGTYEVHELGPPRPPKLGYLRRVPSARAVLRRLRPDLVHAHYATSYGLLALASGVRPLVVTAHGSDVLLGRRNPVYRFVLRRVFRSAALVTVPSLEIRQAVLELAERPVDVETFQYGVEAGRLGELGRRARSSAPPDGEPWRIVTARPLQPLYRLDVILDALGILATRRRDWSFSVFGDGPGREAAEQHVDVLGLADCVSFVGQRPASEVEEALARARIYISLSESDGASIALLEALAVGAVPVVSDIPSNRAWVRDGENGVLSRIEAAAASEAIERALRLDARAVAEANAALVSNHADRDRNLGALEQRLVRLLDERGAHAGAGSGR